MSVGPALALVAALVRGVSLEADLSAQIEARSSAIQNSGGPRESRASGSTSPRALLTLESVPVRLTAAYAPRFWTSDFEARSEPLVNHSADARLSVQPDSGWRTELTVAALRGVTDPLAGWQQTMAVAPESVEVQSTEPLRYEELRTVATGEASFSERTRLAVTGGGTLSRAPEPEGRALLPPQRTATVEVALTRGLTERDTGRLSARGTEATTDLPGGDVRVSTTTALLSWQRLVSPALEARLAGGATLAYGGRMLRPRRADVLWAAEAGVHRGGGETGAELDVSARLTTFVHRLTGEVDSLGTVTAGVARRIGARLTLASTAAVGRTTDGKTMAGRADLRLVYEVHPWLALEAGLNGTWQRERRPERPSFREGSAFMGMAFATERLVSLGDVERAEHPNGNDQEENRR